MKPAPPKINAERDGDDFFISYLLFRLVTCSSRPPDREPRDAALPLRCGPELAANPASLRVLPFLRATAHWEHSRGCSRSWRCRHNNGEYHPHGIVRKSPTELGSQAWRQSHWQSDALSLVCQNPH